MNIEEELRGGSTQINLGGGYLFRAELENKCWRRLGGGRAWAIVRKSDVNSSGTETIGTIIPPSEYWGEHFKFSADFGAVSISEFELRTIADLIASLEKVKAEGTK